MAERPVLVGLIPQAVVLDPGDTVSWISDAGNLKVEFDANRPVSNPSAVKSSASHFDPASWIESAKRLFHSVFPKK